MIRNIITCAIVGLLLWSCDDASTPPTPPKGTSPKKFIDNGTLKVGVDMNSGGSIFFMSEVSTERNLLNHFDRGRFIQQSYYGKTDGSLWAGKPWRWNPIQGGGYLGEPAKVLESNIEKDKLYIKSRPKHWATGEDVNDAVMEEWISFEGANVIKLHFKFTYTGTVPDNPATHQELPAVFVDADLRTMVYYNGAAPWTNAEMTRKVPGWPNEGAIRDEHWAAYIDDTDWGIGVYTPGTPNSTCYRYTSGGTTGPTGGQCSYFAPVRTFAITPDLVFEYDAYVSIGKIEDIRARFYQIKEKYEY